jgi:hypothetical protein
VATAAVVNGGVITMENVDEVEGAAVEVIEEVVFNPDDITLLLLRQFIFRWPWTASASGFANSSNSCVMF